MYNCKRYWQFDNEKKLHLRDMQVILDYWIPQVRMNILAESSFTEVVNNGFNELVG